MLLASLLAPRVPWPAGNRLMRPRMNSEAEAKGRVHMDLTIRWQHRKRLLATESWTGRTAGVYSDDRGLKEQVDESPRSAGNVHRWVPCQCRFELGHGAETVD